MFSTIEKKQRRQKGMSGPTFQKGDFLFYSSRILALSPAKIYFIKDDSYKFMVTKTINYYKNNDMYNGLIYWNYCFSSFCVLFFQ